MRDIKKTNKTHSSTYFDAVLLTWSRRDIARKFYQTMPFSDFFIDCMLVNILLNILYKVQKYIRNKTLEPQSSINFRDVSLVFSSGENLRFGESLNSATKTDIAIGKSITQLAVVISPHSLNQNQTNKF